VPALLREAVLPELFQIQAPVPDGVRRDPAVMCERNINNAQTQVFRMAWPSSRALS
jgi:hypothetical protein